MRMQEEVEAVEKMELRFAFRGELIKGVLLLLVGFRVFRRGFFGFFKIFLQRALR